MSLAIRPAKLGAMCTLAIYLRVFPEYPVVVAANRDEFLARPATPPTSLGHNPEIIGGKDLKAGGTWLGINEHGLVAGLLNRSSNLPPDAKLRSRGLLCLEALRYRTAAEAADYASRQNGADYNYFNLLIASRDEGYVAYNRNGSIEVTRLAPGLHLLTNLDVNDFECPKISHSYQDFARLADRAELANDPDAMRAALAQILASHTTQLDSRSGRPNALCLHLDGYGTRSSSVIMLGAEGMRAAHHFFAAGPPCTDAYVRAPLPGLIAEEAANRREQETSNRDPAARHED